MVKSKPFWLVCAAALPVGVASAVFHISLPVVVALVAPPFALLCLWADR